MKRGYSLPAAASYSEPVSPQCAFAQVRRQTGLTHKAFDCIIIVIAFALQGAATAAPWVAAPETAAE
jgi:hypothetical protein